MKRKDRQFIWGILVCAYYIYAVQQDLDIDPDSWRYLLRETSLTLLFAYGFHKVIKSI